MDVRIIAGRRGEALVAGRIVARIGQWDARSFPGGDWDGSCECEWYNGSDEDAFRKLADRGIEIDLKLYDYNDVCHEGHAAAQISREIASIGDVVTLELAISGTVLETSRKTK